jgi:hypothetical protein
MRLFESLWKDVRFGARMLSKSPGLTSVAVLSLAAYLPSRRAVLVDPIVALRDE